MSTLRPPLPPPLSHEGIRFVAGSAGSGQLSPGVLAQIASALSAEVPAGDFDVTSNGTLIFTADSDRPSLWLATARLEALRGGIS